MNFLSITKTGFDKRYLDEAARVFPDKVNLPVTGWDFNPSCAKRKKMHRRKISPESKPMERKKPGTKSSAIVITTGYGLFCGDGTGFYEAFKTE